MKNAIHEKVPTLTSKSLDIHKQYIARQNINRMNAYLNDMYWSINPNFRDYTKSNNYHIISFIYITIFATALNQLLEQETIPLGVVKFFGGETINAVTIAFEAP